jgi:RimJ/RimL family protein N-acetyltransferase
VSEPEPVGHVELRSGAWTLVPPRPEHGADVLAMFTDPEVQRWNPAPKVVDLASAADWLERSLAWETEWAVWSIVGADGAFAGSCSLWQMDRRFHFSGSVGYRTAPWARRQGVATAAVRAMTGFAFDSLGLERIELVHTVPNVGSCRVAKRAGFALEGTMRAEFRTLDDGRRWDSHLHSLLASDSR